MSAARTQAEISDIELTRVSFHEAGHLVILNAFGGIGSAHIWRNESGDPTEKAWLGHVRMYAKPGELRTIAKVPGRWRIMFGMAGYVAESIYSGDTDPGGLFDSLADDLDYDELSPTDRAAIGSKWNYSDVSTTLELLQSRWDQVLLEANNLIDQGNRLDVEVAA